MAFPITRLRRLRHNENVRRMIRETSVSVDDLIYPLFVCPGKKVREEIPSMPGQYRLSVDLLVEECKLVEQFGIPAVILFGIPEKKDPLGTEGYAENGIIQQALRAVKKECSTLVVITDVCLCEYTDHGHCGVVEDGQVVNDPSLDRLGLMAISHVEAGADIVAPSDMMDGRIGFIRDLFESEEYTGIPIMAYSAKYASAFYGPFRDAVDSEPRFGDRRSYQMDPPNIEEALREVALDIEEGADIVMVKPALAYLDVICQVKQEFSIPLAAYNVSGEYAMIKAASAKGWLNETRVVMETVTAIKRAGADLILTYFAKDIANHLMRASV